MKDNNKLKSNAKSLGLKSTLLVDNSIVLTSFANQSAKKGEKKKPVAHIEKITDTMGNIKLNQEKMFKSDVNSDDIQLDGYIPKEDGTKEKVKPIIPNPVKLGDDYIGVKSELEELFFGKSFADDNVHVQIAYNIYDIRKILTLYINNIIFAFENLGRLSDEEDDQDYVGVAVSNKSYSEAKVDQKHSKEFMSLAGFLKRIQSYGDYFPGMFKTPSSFLPKGKKLSDCSDAEKDRINEKCKSENFQTIRVLSIARQIVCHAVYRTARGQYRSETALFNLDYILKNNNCGDVLNHISDVYSRAVNKVNQDFKKNSKNNLYILANVLGQDTKDMVTDYYRYNILKTQNTIGIDTKHLREIIYDNYFSFIKDKKYDTDRSKLNTILTFILLRELETGKYDEMTSKLRGCQIESSKEEIYQKYAKLIWKEISNKFNSALKMFDNEARNKFKNSFEFSERDYYSVVITTDGANTFVKLLYFISRFLDGKEVNELLCSMINKFDNISELIQISKLAGKNIEFAQNFKMFDNSASIASMLRVVKNVAQMKPEPTSIKEEMVADALKMLNCKNYKLEENELGMLIRDNEDYKTFHAVLYENKKGGQTDHQMLNFIINNVVKSKWFSYIVKYNNPSKCASLMHNKSVLNFVIKDIPESQIIRYYQTITASDNIPNYDAMKTTIINALYNFNVDATIKKIGELSTAENKKQDPKSDKEKSKAIINLYLTVAYLITKSMVKVNSRFAIALACVDRDTYIYTGQECKKVGYLYLTKTFMNEDKPIVDYCHKVLAELKENKEKTGDDGLAYRTEKHKELDEKEKKLHFSKKWNEILFSNLVNAEIVRTSCVTPKGFDFYDILRDKIAHVNVISALSDYIEEIGEVNSYYELYCAVIQRVMTAIFKKSKPLAEYKDEKHMEKGASYSKDFMWMMNMPFAYNLARYKNLSNEYLFYDKDRKQK